ncbi:hypothetical protein GNI_198530 [Gregarina niphandrodes]|uniref:Uncharacterized protein n=1 Tax=Gregarina niphandrodes TaxID=110365 RepID=A0A023AWA4_GRENI|nr:hypothetical protein GNI_198530 [Gregarina niphandrodes]EZG42999.1 hypothetical protein GNI_198530 [Gregarina niphandrodes]|eukprot:XP_011133728.1 hypothetical protein GNI_198530 [Gregarina niphandrodes]
MVETRSTMDVHKEARTIIIEANKSGNMDAVRVQAIPPKVWGEVCTTLDCQRLLQYNRLLLQTSFMREMEAIIAEKEKAEQPAFTHRKIQEAVPVPVPAQARPPMLDLTNVNQQQQQPMLEEVYYADRSSDGHRRDRRHTLTTDEWSHIDYLVGDPGQMLNQLKGVRMSPERAFEVRNKILRKTLVDPEIDDSDKLIARINQLIDKGLISHDLSVNILLSCIAYGKEGTMQRIESGQILKPLGVYNVSSRKRPEERKTKPQAKQTAANSTHKKKYPGNSANQNRRGSLPKTTEATKNRSQGTK